MIRTVVEYMGFDYDWMDFDASHYGATLINDPYEGWDLYAGYGKYTLRIWRKKDANL